MDLSILKDRLCEIDESNEIFGGPLRVKKGEAGANTCEFDLTKHILDYLPTPVINVKEHDDDEDTVQTESTSMSTLGMSILDSTGSTSVFDDGSMSVSDRSSVFMKKGRESTIKSMKAGMKHLGALDASVKEEGSTKDNENRPARRKSHLRGSLDSIKKESICIDPEFDSVFRPEDMRMLALVSHNNMKHSMKQFVKANMNVLKKFRLTGTNTTMSMLREVFGNDPSVVYGPACKSGPLGGDAQLVAMAVTGELGGCIFFIDPMDAHPHSADIECLVRQGNVHNILMMNNPCSAHVCMNTCRVALKMGHMEMIPSFFFDLESPSVEAYKVRQKAVLNNAIARNSIRNSIRSNGNDGSIRRRNSYVLQVNKCSLKSEHSESEGSHSDDLMDEETHAKDGNLIAPSFVYNDKAIFEMVIEEDAEDEMIEEFLKDEE